MVRTRKKGRPPLKQHSAGLYRRTDQLDDLGHRDPASDVLVASGLDCSIEPLSGRELEIARQQYETISHRVRMFLDPEWQLDAAHYLIDEDTGRRYEIAEETTPENLGFEFILTVAEIVPANLVKGTSFVHGSVPEFPDHIGDIAEPARIPFDHAAAPEFPEHSGLIQRIPITGWFDGASAPEFPDHTGDLEKATVTFFDHISGAEFPDHDGLFDAPPGEFSGALSLVYSPPDWGELSVLVDWAPALPLTGGGGALGFDVYFRETTNPITDVFHPSFLRQQIADPAATFYLSLDAHVVGTFVEFGVKATNDIGENAGIKATIEIEGWTQDAFDHRAGAEFPDHDGELFYPLETVDHLSGAEFPSHEGELSEIGEFDHSAGAEFPAHDGLLFDVLPGAWLGLPTLVYAPPTVPHDVTSYYLDWSSIRPATGGEIRHIDVYMRVQGDPTDLFDPSRLDYTVSGASDWVIAPVSSITPGTAYDVGIVARNDEGVNAGVSVSFLAIYEFVDHASGAEFPDLDSEIMEIGELDHASSAEIPDLDSVLSLKLGIQHGSRLQPLKHGSTVDQTTPNPVDDLTATPI